ncbi:hypothetical protein BKA80DRAFT_96743 [Phyllosticta citrichinensis]
MTIFACACGNKGCNRRSMQFHPKISLFACCWCVLACLLHRLYIHEGRRVQNRPEASMVKKGGGGGTKPASQLNSQTATPRGLSEEAERKMTLSNSMTRKKKKKKKRKPAGQAEHSGGGTKKGESGFCAEKDVREEDEVEYVADDFLVHCQLQSLPLSLISSLQRNQVEEEKQKDQAKKENFKEIPVSSICPWVPSLST